MTWTFATPPLTLVASHPAGGPARRDPLLFVAFDQKIDAQTVVRCPPDPGRRPELPRAPRHRREDRGGRHRQGPLERSESGRFIAFRAEAPLPADAEVTVTVPAGTPSAEGPKTTTKAQDWRFRTFGPLRVKSHRCGYNGQCPPFTPFQIEFTNPIDAKAFRKEMVTVSPALPGLKAAVYGPTLNLSGASKGRTRYTVTLGAEVPDTFGQTLESPQTVTFDVGSAQASLFAPGGNLVVLDPAAGPRFSVYSVNQTALRVRATAVTPEDWPAFLKFMQAGSDAKAAAPGRTVLETVVKVQGQADELTETRLDLRPALPGGARATRLARRSGPARRRNQQQRDGSGLSAHGSSLGAGHEDRPRRVRGRPEPAGLGDIARGWTSPGPGGALPGARRGRGGHGGQWSRHPALTRRRARRPRRATRQ